MLVLVLGGCPGDDASVVTSGSTTEATGTGPGLATGTSSAMTEATEGATQGTTQGTTEGTGGSSSGDPVDPDATAGETTAGTLDGSGSTTADGDSSESSGGETGGTGEQGYGDCLNNPAEDVCLRGETCVHDTGTPPGVGVCALQACGGAGACPSAPPGGDATPACMDVSGDMIDECVLQCSGGASCPTGMACFAEFVCVWGGGIGPGDFTCADEDLGWAMGAAVATGSTVGMGNDFAPGCVGPNGQDVHLMWTPLVAGTYTFDTVGSSYDTILYVLEDCVGAELSCNDDTMDLQSEVTVELQAGQTVLVVIDGYGNASGNYVLNVG